MILDDPTSYWSILASLLIGVAPLLLLFLIAMIVALVYLRRHRRPALCVFAAFFTMFVVSIIELVIRVVVQRKVMVGEWSYEEFATWLVAIGVFTTVVRASGMGLLVLAAFGWRGQRPAADVSANLRPGTLSSTPLAPVGDTPPTAVHGASLAAGPTAVISRGLFIGSIFGSTILVWLLIVPGIILMFQRAEELKFAGLGLVCFGYIPLIYAIVMVGVLVYKLWDTIRGGPARTTPGKAVGFLFIPFYNFYWVFQAYRGWAIDFNRYIEHHSVNAKPMPEGLALAVSILMVLSAIPYLGTLFGIVNFALLWMFFSQAITAANVVRGVRVSGAESA